MLPKLVGENIKGVVHGGRSCARRVDGELREPYQDDCNGL